MTGGGSRRIDRLGGTGIPVRGHDLDTDRIIPARFLVSVTFEGLEAHVFEDDRRQAADAGQVHPFSNAAYAGASILVVSRNFGCGSSREHAPQALYRWGIRAAIGESFSEIFRGNALAIGLPCVTASEEDVEALMERVEETPATRLSVSVADLRVVAEDGFTAPLGLPDAVRSAFLDGTWDATGLLLERFEDVQAVAARLPYVQGFPE